MRALLRHALEHRDRLGLRLRLENVVIGEILRLRIAARSDTRCRVLQIVERAPQHDLWPKQQPVRSRIPIGHADAARVHNAHAIHGAVELHMRVPTDNDPLPDAGQHSAQALFWRRRRDHLLVAARRAAWDPGRYLLPPGSGQDVPAQLLSGQPLTRADCRGYHRERPSSWGSPFLSLPELLAFSLKS